MNLYLSDYSKTHFAPSLYALLSAPGFFPHFAKNSSGIKISPVGANLNKESCRADHEILFAWALLHLQITTVLLSEVSSMHLCSIGCHDLVFFPLASRANWVFS